MNILLLGGSGRLGCAMQRQWTDHCLIVPEPEAVNILKQDQLENALCEHTPDLVVNVAAYNNVDGAEGAERELCFQLNAAAPALIAKLTKQHGIPLIHFSTDYIFEGAKPEGYTEADEPRPQSVYAQSKYDGELAVRHIHPKSYIVRTSRLFGPQAAFSGSKPSFVELILREAQQAQTVPVNPTEVSAPTYVDDLARHIQTHLFSFPVPGAYHMANSGGATWQAWAQEIIAALDWPVTITARDPATLIRAARRPAYSILQSIKVPAMRPWQEALRAYLALDPPIFSPLWRHNA